MKNLKKLSVALMLALGTTFAMTSCGGAAEDAAHTEEAVAAPEEAAPEEAAPEEAAPEEVAPEEVAPDSTATCEGGEEVEATCEGGEEVEEAAH